MMAVPKRFAVLRFFGNLMKVVAWIFLVLAIVSSIGAGIAGSLFGSAVAANFPFVAELMNSAGGIVAGLVVLFFGLFYFLLLYVIGEAIQMQLAMEENTRLTAALLLKMHQDSQVEEPPSYTPGGFASEPFDG
jgi:hypothetical protein